MEERTQIEKRNRTKRLRHYGLMVGLLGGVLATSIIWAFAEFGPFAVVIPILVLGGILTLASKKPFIGGILLIVVSIPLTLFGLPLLASGILFVLSWMEGRKYLKGST